MANRLIHDPGNDLSPSLKETLRIMHEERVGLREKIYAIEDRLEALAKTHHDCQRLITIPGVGMLTATILLTLAGEIRRFRNGREFAAFLGLVPRQDSSEGKNVLLGISKRGDSYIRTFLVHGGRSIVRSVLHLAASQEELRECNQWVFSLNERRGYNRTAVAVANKNARIVWALLTWKDEVYSSQGPKAPKAA